MSEWTSDSGHDSNSVLANDLSAELVNVQEFEYLTPPVKNLALRDTVELKEGSLFEDAGIELDNITDGYSGYAPDLGWVEYLESNDGDGNGEDETDDEDGNNNEPDDGTDTPDNIKMGSSGSSGCFIDQIMNCNSHGEEEQRHRPKI